MASPVDLILHDHCLDAGCIGFSEAAGCIGFSEAAGCIGFSEAADIGVMVFPPDVKHLSEATLMECIHLHPVTDDKYRH